MGSKGFTRFSVLGVLAAVLMVVTPPESANALEPDIFYRCYFDYCGHASQGTITWNNRTANISGWVVDGAVGGDSTTVFFEAFAGSVKIDSTTRTQNTSSTSGSFRDFNFSIGDPNLRGGIDRIKVTVCINGGGGSRSCGNPENYAKV